MAPFTSFGQSPAPEGPTPPEEPQPPAPSAERTPADASPPSAGSTPERSARSGSPGPRLAARRAVSPRGSTGLLRTSAAHALLPGLFRVSLGLDFFAADGTIRDGDNASRVRGILGISGSPIDFMELWFNVGVSSTSNDFTDPTLLQSLGDLGFGIKGFYPIVDIFSAGAEIELRLLSDVGSSGIGAVQAEPRAVMTLDLTQLASPLPVRGHLNFGYLYDGTEDLGDGAGTFTTAEQFALGLAEFDRLVGHVGVEVPVEFVTPYLEYGIEIPLGYEARPGVIVEPTGDLTPKQAVEITVEDGPARPATARVIPQRLTPGVRVTALRDFAFDAAVEIGLTPDTARGVPVVPAYNVVFLASYNFDPFDVRGQRGGGGPTVSVPVVVPSGPGAGGARLIGTVVDRDSGEPIEGAIVRFDRSTPVATDDAGRFASQILEGGPLRVIVSAPGYEPGSAELELPSGEDSEVEVELAPAGARIRGTVEGPEGPRAGVRVAILGPEEQTVETDERGTFALPVTPGSYRLLVEPGDGMATGARIEAEAGETSAVALRIQPAPDEPLEPVDGRFPLGEPLLFEPGSVEPPADASRILAPIVDRLLRRPDLEVRIAGHTDNRGEPGELAELSRERAEAIRDVLVKDGVPESQLSVQGFGADRPITPNVTRRGRAQNNRVEILVAPE